MIHLKDAHIRFICGSQHLYGPGPLKVVAENAQQVAAALDGIASNPLPIKDGGVVTTRDEIEAALRDASSDDRCAGVIVWMHTFSPSKMWIRGLRDYRKPLLHLHTQANRDLPWDTIDMDFMNLNQAAHGDREFASLLTRMRRNRKSVVGHWSDEEVQNEIVTWVRAARAQHDLHGASFARFGDNMRHVGVTEGDKVAAEIRLGVSVEGYGLADLMEHVNAVSPALVDALVDEYQGAYAVASELQPGGAQAGALRDGAAIELGLRSFLEAGGFKGFTTTFENLAGLKQLPGLAVQRLMADGYGFGAEGDWKTAVLLRGLKVAAEGMPGGTSFMEDYTYHLEPGRHRVLGSHMLEVCPSIAAERPRLEVHPLGIGDREDPVRLVFDAPAGDAINVSIMDLGNRLRLLVNEVEAVEVPDLPNLPVARALWECKPDFKTALKAWLEAGGAHHTVYSYDVKTALVEDLAHMLGIECVVIDANTDFRSFRSELQQSDAAYGSVDA